MRSWIEFALFLLVALPITYFDIREYRIPDSLTFSGIAVFVILKLFWKEQPFGMLALEGIIGFGAFWLIYRASGGQIGMGDAKFSALIAVAAGLSTWFAALLVASVTGLLCAALFIILFKADRRTRFPFAPFLPLAPLSHSSFPTFIFYFRIYECRETLCRDLHLQPLQAFSHRAFARSANQGDGVQEPGNRRYSPCARGNVPASQSCLMRR